jgi:hypothetical protein
MGDGELPAEGRRSEKVAQAGRCLLLVPRLIIHLWQNVEVFERGSG